MSRRVHVVTGVLRSPTIFTLPEGYRPSEPHPDFTGMTTGEIAASYAPQPTSKEGEMPATAIPGTPANADEIEAIALKHMDLQAASDRQAAYEQAQHLAEEAVAKRDGAILALLQHGFQQQEVADAMGISRGRVAQIARRGARS